MVVIIKTIEISILFIVNLPIIAKLINIESIFVKLLNWQILFLKFEC